MGCTFKGNIDRGQWIKKRWRKILVLLVEQGLQETVITEKAPPQPIL